jgi:hypothetical protein
VDQLRVIQASVADWVRSAPGTYTYLFAITVTSWSLGGVHPHLADVLIRSQSTNLDNLADRPLQVLVASAFWTSGTVLPWQLLVRFTLILAPVERRLGTRRAGLVFAAGHVLATLVVAAGLQFGVRHGWLDVALAHASDVGVSYGLVAVAGAMTWLIAPARWRAAWAPAVLAAISLGDLGGLTFTDVGHLVSLVIGLSTAPLVRRWQSRPVPRAPLGGRPLRVPTSPQARRILTRVASAVADVFRLGNYWPRQGSGSSNP